MTEREAVVLEARRWLGTPFRDQKDNIGAGVDCAMLIIRCFVDTGILPPFDPRPYPTRWHLHQDRERFLEWVEQKGRQTDEIKLGNVVVYKEGRCFSHGAIVASENTVIHAWWVRGEVVESRMSDPKLDKVRINREWVDRPRRIYDVWA